MCWTFLDLQWRVRKCTRGSQRYVLYRHVRSIVFLRVVMKRARKQIAIKTFYNALHVHARSHGPHVRVCALVCVRTARKIGRKCSCFFNAHTKLFFSLPAPGRHELLPDVVTVSDRLRNWPARTIASLDFMGQRTHMCQGQMAWHG